MDKVKIKFDNVFAQVIGATEEIENIIATKLSFTVEEFGSDNVLIRRLFNRKTKKTYTGLISYIIEILEENQIEYELEDNRIKPEKNADFNLITEIDVGGKKIPLEVRPYQKVIIDRATERECIQAATGAGKTFIMAGLIDKFKVKPVLVFADKLSLVTQIKDEFEKFLGVDVGIIGGGMNDVKDITICSVQSMLEQDELLQKANMIMFDECLAYDTLILMEDGTYEKIGDLVENQSNKKVLTYNHKTNKIEAKNIISYSKTKLSDNGKKLMKITVRNKNGEKETIVCTDNHKIWVDELNDYVYAKDLIKGQTLKIIKKQK
jgi:DNA or RNA helicases of superfamily II